jgi:hypothetical protein
MMRITFSELFEALRTERHQRGPGLAELDDDVTVGVGPIAWD